MSTTGRIRQLEGEAQHLRSSSDALQALTAELDKTTGACDENSRARTRLHKQLGGIDSQHAEVRRQQEAVGHLLADVSKLVATAARCMTTSSAQCHRMRSPTSLISHGSLRAQDATREALTSQRTTLADRQQAAALQPP